MSATIASALEDATGHLSAAGIEDARREARLLLGHALGVGPETVIGYPERGLDGSAQARFAALVARRAARMPTDRILGQREFWSLPFSLDATTLTPRPDSETVVEAALAACADRSRAIRILDLGTGSGCLLLALLSELVNATGVGVDLSVGALVRARGNAGRLGLGGRCRWLRADWGAALLGGFDLIVANPPYVARGEIAQLAPEVADYEPRLALDGGPDGLDAYRALAADVARLMAPGGCAAIEIGAGQSAGVSAIFRAHGLAVARTAHDLRGIARCLVLRGEALALTKK
jgi:release factor glutamine methyltransferase